MIKCKEKDVENKYRWRKNKMKTISDKIFELLKEKGMSQKEFAQRTGIAESSTKMLRCKECLTQWKFYKIINTYIRMRSCFLESSTEEKEYWGRIDLLDTCV